MCILSSLLRPWMLERMETTIETDVRLTFISIMWRLWASLFNYCFFLLITFDFWCNNENDKMRKQILPIRWLTPWTLNTANISVKCDRTFFTIMKWNCIIVTNLNWFCVLSWGSINAIMLYNICYQLDSLLRFEVPLKLKTSPKVTLSLDTFRWIDVVSKQTASPVLVAIKKSCSSIAKCI